MYNDDDDPELQDAQKLESPGRAKLQALQQKLKQEGLSSTERMDLQELKKSMLKHQVEKKKGRKGKERTERRVVCFLREREISERAQACHQGNNFFVIF